MNAPELLLRSLRLRRREHLVTARRFAVEVRWYIAVGAACDMVWHAATMMKGYQEMAHDMAGEIAEARS